MRYGIVGLATVVLLSVVTIVWIHRRLLLMPKGRERVLATLILSVLMGWLVAEVLVKAVITTFPLNALFWLFLGMLGNLVISTRKAPPTRYEPPKTVQPESPPSRGLPQGHERRLRHGAAGCAQK
jgi:hypothetical protein